MSVQIQDFNKLAKIVTPDMPYTKEAFLARKKELLDDIEKTQGQVARDLAEGLL